MKKKDNIFVEEDIQFEQLVKSVQAMYGDTQADLANKLNCKQPTLSNVLGGRSGSENAIIDELENYIASGLLQAFDLMAGRVNNSQDAKIRTYVKRQSKNFRDRL